MAPDQVAQSGARSRWPWWRWLWLAVAGAGLFVAATIFLPRVFGLYWGYWGIRSLFHDELSRSAAESELAAIVGAFFYAFFWVPMLWLTIRSFALPNRARRLIPLFALWVLFYGLTPVARLMLGADVCFNQATGEPLKWFVLAPDGTLSLYDSPGFDALGVEKQPVTPQICRIVELQAKGIRPKQISNPGAVEYFDATSGRAMVWYSVDSANRVRLFDAEGFDPASGALLQPITQDVIARVAAQEAAAREAERQAAAEEAERERLAAQVAAERAAAEAEQQALAQLVSIFDPGAYSQDVVIFGGAATDQGEVSQEAVGLVMDALGSAARASGLQTDRFRSAVYSSGNFDRLLDGDLSALAKVGLDMKMRSAVLVSVAAHCRPADAVSSVVSCDMTTKARVLSPRSGLSVMREQTVTGAGATNHQALSRAADLLRERYPQLLEGV